MKPAPDALAALHDIHLPDPIGLWPPAPGWWVVLLVAAAFVLWQALRVRARRRSPDRIALDILDELHARFEADGNSVALATGLSRLLRRISLARFDRRESAGLHGEARGRALAAADRTAPIPVELIERLESVVYRSDSGDVVPREQLGWIDATRRFIGVRSSEGPSPATRSSTPTSPAAASGSRPSIDAGRPGSSQCNTGRKS